MTTRANSASARSAEPADDASGPKALRSAEDEQRIALALEQHFDSVWRSLRRLGVHESDADDAAQHVFLQLSQRIKTVEVGRERPYLLGIAVRVAANARRKQARTSEDPSGELEHRASSSSRELRSPKRWQRASTAPRSAMNQPSRLLESSNTPPALPGLAQEVARIDEARRALARGHASDALRHLDAYAALDRTGTLDREAQLLRIDALVLGPDRARGVDLAQQYLSRYPKDPHAARLRALLGDRSTAPATTPQ